MAPLQILDVLRGIPGGIRSLSFPGGYFRPHDFLSVGQNPANQDQEQDDFDHLCTQCLARLILCQLSPWWRVKREQPEVQAVDLDRSFDTSSGSPSVGATGNSSLDDVQGADVGLDGDEAMLEDDVDEEVEQADADPDSHA